MFQCGIKHRKTAYEILNCLKGLVSNGAQLGCGQALSRHSVVLENSLRMFSTPFYLTVLIAFDSVKSLSSCNISDKFLSRISTTIQSRINSLRTSPNAETSARV